MIRGYAEVAGGPWFAKPPGLRATEPNRISQLFDGYHAPAWQPRRQTLCVGMWPPARGFGWLLERQALCSHAARGKYQKQCRPECCQSGPPGIACVAHGLACCVKRVSDFVQAQYGAQIVRNSARFSSFRRSSSGSACEDCLTITTWAWVSIQIHCP